MFWIILLIFSLAVWFMSYTPKFPDRSELDKYKGYEDCDPEERNEREFRDFIESIVEDKMRDYE
jgi:hypothetical protein